MTHRCPSCKCEEGELHKEGCYFESCPFCTACGGQCNCIYKLSGLQVDHTKEFFGLPEYIYHNGPTPEMEEEFEKMIKKKGRVPFIQWPNGCFKCHKTNPKMFMVPDEEWEYYIEPLHHDKVICLDCYKEIKSKIDKKQGPYQFRPIPFEWEGKLYGHCRCCGKNDWLKEKMRYSDDNIVYLCTGCWNTHLYDR